MKYLKEIYNSYLKNLEEEKEIVEIEKNLKTVSREEISEGNIYMLIHNDHIIFYVIIGKTDEFYEVLKMSECWRLANQNDLITEILGETFIVETWNKFYLTENEIKESVFFGKLPGDDLKILKDFLEGKIKEFPKNKRGLTVPEGNYKFYQNKFHKNESLIVKDFTLRIFKDLINE